MTHSNIIISSENLSYSYQEAGETKVVLDGVDLSIKRGELVALLGESGSGKSTLLNLLGCIDKADSGTVLINETMMGNLKEPQLTLFRRQYIGIIYQLFNLIPTLSVFENIALPLELAGVNSSDRKKQVGDWLKRVGLVGRESAYPDQLSGGEQQRVAVARALIHRPSLVLADEPTGNLDAQTGQKILDLLVGLSREQGQTLLIVTHSKVVAEMADRVLVLESGKIGSSTNSSTW